ncbi:MAG: leucine-rich repeat domain-containing protein [Clostridia bacterium]|nr:leucine-rich repeat domain-containing protein [Clostridia bacterium]
MKKLLVLFALFALLMLLPVIAEEQTVYVLGDYQYILLEDGTAKITSYKGNEENLQIPDQLNGYTVTSVGDEAFSRSSLTSVTIPESIRDMGANPFLGCERLEIIRVSSKSQSFATIDGVLFNKTEKKLVCYPKAFDAESYSIPNGILAIGDEAFYWCTPLKSITIPQSVTEIGNSAFSLTSLTEINLPESITTIGGDAFSACSSLTSIFIPKGVSDISANPFVNCGNLTEIQLSPENQHLEIVGGVLFHKAEKKLICYPGFLKDESYSIPDGILSIGEGAFHGSRSLYDVTIPQSVTVIGACAFSECSQLAGIILPDGVTEIGDGAFSLCSALSGINIPEGVTKIGDSVFNSCKSLVSITLPQSVTEIGSSAFRSCSSLTSISISENITSIGNNAFRSCVSLKGITLPEGITTIGDYAFGWCKALTDIKIPKSVTVIGKDAFIECGNILFEVEADSYAEKWANGHGFNYTYTESLDWLFS